MAASQHENTDTIIDRIPSSMGHPFLEKPTMETHARLYHVAKYISYFRITSCASLARDKKKRPMKAATCAVDVSDPLELDTGCT